MALTLDDTAKRNILYYVSILGFGYEDKHYHRLLYVSTSLYDEIYNEIMSCKFVPFVFLRLIFAESQTNFVFRMRALCLYFFLS